MTAPDPYCDHGPFDACRCLAQPPAEVITVDVPGPLDLQPAFAPAPLAALTGIPVRARLEPGDLIAAIVKDHDGRVIGYIARSDVDRLQAQPSVDYMVRYERMAQPAPDPEPPADAENMHVYLHEFDPIGGFVCAECGTPTESEPCKDHQPNAYAKMT